MRKTVNFRQVLHGLNTDKKNYFATFIIELSFGKILNLSPEKKKHKVLKAM